MKKEISIGLKDILDGRKMTRYALHKQTGIHFQIIDNYYKNKVTRYDSNTLLQICRVLECDVSDLIKITDVK